MMSKSTSMFAIVLLVLCGSSILVSARAKRADRMAKPERGGNNVSCSIHTCVGPGDACSPCNNPGVPCDDGCPYPTRCLTVAEGSICLVNSQGQECTTAGQECDNGFGEVEQECQADGDTNICLPETPNNLVAGDFCDSSSNCQGSLQCTDNVCVGAAEGEACNDMEDCNAGLFCDEDGLIDADTCQPFTGAGSVCSEDEDCGAWFTCENGGDFGEPCTDTNNDCCFARNSRGAGEACGSDKMCASNLICEGDICIEPDTSTVGNQCSTDAECVHDGINCECDFETGNGVCVLDVNFCDDKKKAVEECLVNKGCNLESDFDNEYSCARSKCLDKYLAKEDCEGLVSDATNSDSCQAIGRLNSGASSLSSILFF